MIIACKIIFVLQVLLYHLLRILSSKTNIIIHIRYIKAVEFMKRISMLRKEKHLNQVGLALKLNVSQKMISAYENGTHQPSIDTLIKMSGIFNVSVDYIIENSDIRMPAESIMQTGLSAEEIELLGIFREMDAKKRQKALGILFALKHYND